MNELVHNGVWPLDPDPLSGALWTCNDVQSDAVTLPVDQTRNIIVVAVLLFDFASL